MFSDRFFEHSCTIGTLALNSFAILLSSLLVRLHLQYFAIFCPPCLHSLLCLYKMMICTFSLDSQSMLPVLVSLSIVLSVVAPCRSPSASRTGLATKASQWQEYVALCVQLSVNQLTPIQHYNCDFFRWFPKLHDSPRILAAIPPSAHSPDLSASSSSQSAAPAKTTKGRQPRKQGKPCGGPFCKH
jgi:hypothetical protein